jgi:hypothetical protein
MEKLDVIKKILWEDWDPIGINVISPAKDEYDSYAPQVYKLLTKNESKEVIGQYLTYVDTELIGNSPNKERDVRVAQKLIQSFGGQ